ncbi:hypothetical protein J8C08_08525 [Chloracidobacterium thermophilum]|nr:hypothetical protein J8C08_08525 [Chloracidobacterium thermophilum]
MARVTQRPLVLQPELLDRIRHQFESRGLKMALTTNDRRLCRAMLRRSATNTARRPGIVIAEGDRLLILLPGPPREMRPMFTAYVRPKLTPLAGSARLRTRTLRVAGMASLKWMT